MMSKKKKRPAGGGEPAAGDGQRSMGMLQLYYNSEPPLLSNPVRILRWPICLSRSSSKGVSIQRWLGRRERGND
jgi:hypothetical protein